MFYSMYLQSVCTRRHWPEPLYEPLPHPSSPNQYHCKVRVNNRQYATDVPYKTPALAREGAAMNAYMICRNFSHNDGMYPGARPGHRGAQGLPVAIGTGRGGYSDGGSGSGSGGSSPTGSGTGSGPEEYCVHRRGYGRCGYCYGGERRWS